MKKILMVCEAFGGGVFSYVSQLCNDLCDDFEVYLLYALRPQTPPQYQKFLDKRVRLIPAQRLGSKNILNPYADRLSANCKLFKEKSKPTLFICIPLWQVESVGLRIVTKRFLLFIPRTDTPIFLWVRE